MNLDIVLMEKYLQRALEEFDTTPLATQLMRRLATETPEIFFPVAMQHLSSNVQSNGHRLLTVLVMRDRQLLNRIASPGSNSREDAVNLFRRFLSVDPSFDVKLARKLPGRTYWNQEEVFDGTHSTRALDILDQTSRGRRLLPILGHLPDSPDSRISAKATLFVGRRVQSPQWTEKQLSRPDQRVRANAVEALWGVDSAPAIRILEDCVGDKNCRVAGNSVVGLHIVGRESARTAVLSMSRAGKADARSTAAWAMGRLALPMFFDRLTELVRDDHPQVRGTALRALLEIRRKEVPIVKAPAPEVAEVLVAQVAQVVHGEEPTQSPETEVSAPLRLDGRSFTISKR